MVTATSKLPDQRSYRLSSIDMLRGLIIVIMALDHVRDFVLAGAMQDPMQDPNVTPLLFFTRWITHFCAPVFVFLAGTSAGLMTSRKTPEQLSGFLFKRGLWLLFIEIFFISTAITFSPLAFLQPGGQTVLIMQTLSAIGVSMIVLALAQFMGQKTCLILGASIVLGHNLLDPIWPVSVRGGPDAPLWAALHVQMGLNFDHVLIFFAYPFLPWIGVMLLGFGSSALFRNLPDRRNASLLKIGAGLIAAFILLRALDIYGDSHHWSLQSEGMLKTIMSFLNTTKYPPSLLYLLMTLGPAALICANADRFKGWIKDTLIMYGRVPFAFYVGHYFLAHLMGVVIGLAQGYTLAQMTDFGHTPEKAGLNLAGVYLVWIVVVMIMYPCCHWMARLKSKRTDWWLSYL